MAKTGDLPVCAKCGWHWVPPHDDCSPEAKETADALIKAADHIGVGATRLGYGQRMVAFAFSKKLTVVVRCFGGGKFEINHTHSRLDFSAETALEFFDAFRMLVQAARR